MLAAEWGVGQVLWSILWFFLFFMWIWLVISVFTDIIRSDDMGGVAKAVWSIFIIFVPYIGVFVYLIVRGGSMGRRAVAEAQASEAAFRSYVQEAAGTTSVADELMKLGQLRDAGQISEAEYAQLRARVMGS